ncbi:hypothetical protein YN1_5000 [Nanoarchaeota archaeon]
MEKKYKGGHRNISFMMKGKTLAAIGALTALGLAIYAQSGTPTIGQLAQAMKTNPTAWTVVVGANAKASDVVGASNIIAALETFTSVPTTSSVNTSSLQVQLQGTIPVLQNSYPLYTQGQPLYLGDSLSTSIQTIQVGSGSFTANYNGQQTTYSYTAYVQTQPSYTLSYVQATPGQSTPEVALATTNPQSSPIALTVYFTPALNLTQLSQSPQPIQIFNTTYYIVPSSNSNYINFVPAAQVVTLNVNQSTTFNGVQITLQGVTAQYSSGTTVSSGVPAAVLNINGQTYTVQVGSQLYVDGVNILVVNIYGPLSTVVSTTQTGYVELVLGTSGYQLPISTTPANILTSSGQVLDNAQVQMSEQGTNLISSITFLFPQLPEIGTSGNYGVVNGHSYPLPLFNYELTFPSVTIPAQNSDLVQVQASTVGSMEYQFTLSYPDAVTGKTYSFTLFNYNGDLVPFQTGTVTTSAPVTTTYYYAGEFVPINMATPINATTNYTSMTITTGQYFAVYNPTAGASQIFQLQSITTGSNGQPEATVEDVISGQTYTLYQGQPLIVADGVAINVTAINTNESYVTLSAPNGYGVNLNSLWVVLPGPSPTQSPVLSLTGFGNTSVSVEISEYYPGYTGLNTNPDNATFTLSATNGIGAPTTTDIPKGVVEPLTVTSGTTTVSYWLDMAGTYITETSTGSSGTQTLAVYVPLTPITYPISLAPTGAQTQQETTTVGVGQTIPGTQLTVVGVSGVSTTGYSQPTALVGKVILDTQVTPSMSDIVVVGGPAVNMLAADAIRQWVAEMNSTLAMQLPSSGYITGSQLQPVLQQLGVDFGPGTSLIFVGGQYPNELVIFGWYGNDTTEATELFANYLLYGTDAAQLSNYTLVLLNDQQTVNGLPSVTPIQ